MTPNTQEKLNNKQRTEKGHLAKGVVCLEHTREWGRSKELLSM
jgi:hypothetical protein